MKLGRQILNNTFGLVVLVSLVCLTRESVAQTSVFQDTKGESAFKVFGSAVTVNASDQNVSFSSDFIKRKNNNNTKFGRWGINAKVTANEGISNFKNEDGFLVDGEVGIYRGWKKTVDPLTVNNSTPAWSREYYLSLNGSVDRNKLFDVSRAQDAVTYNKGFGGFKLEGGVFGYRKSLFGGISVNGGIKTNVDALKKRTVVTALQSAYTNNVIVYKEESAFSSQEFKGGLWMANVNADIAYAIDNVTDNVGPILLAFHFRYQALENTKNKFNPALGIYLSKVGAPQDVVVGISAQCVDIFNVDNTKNNAFQRLALNVTAGFKID